jgi:hypothetical protein
MVGEDTVADDTPCYDTVADDIPCYDTVADDIPCYDTVADILLKQHDLQIHLIQLLINHQLYLIRPRKTTMSNKRQ